MSRLDWHKGRWDADKETDEIFKGLTGYRDVFGDWFLYYRFNFIQSEVNDIYDEGEGRGRVYEEPLRVPAIHVTHVEGEERNGDTGFYYNDQLTAVIAYDAFIYSGMRYADIQTGKYLKDRIVYDDKVFRIQQISVEGQVQQRDIIVFIQATQMKPDELTDDPQFIRWSN